MVGKPFLSTRKNTVPERFATYLVLLLITFSSVGALGEDWPHWRGPMRNGVTMESSRWDEKGWPPKVLWRANVGIGGTSPLVVKDRLYVMGWRDGRDHVQCLDVGTGQSHWSVAYDCRQYGRFATGDEGLYSGVTSTPEYDAETGLLYTLSTDGHLHAWDTRREGKRAWGFNLYDQFDVTQRPKPTRIGHRDYGYTASPLVNGDRLIVEVGSSTGTLMAFDKRSGKADWSSRSTEPAGHTAGPVPIVVEGKPCVAVLHLNGLLVARTDAGHEGETVAEYPWPTDYANNIASPAIRENFVLITSGYNQNKMARIRITLRGAEKVWEHGHLSQICTPVVDGGKIYWSWERMYSVDEETGVLSWKGDSLGEAGSCVITSDNRLIAWTGRGTLTLVETAKRSPGAYQRLFQMQVLAQTDAWPHVVLADRRLFCKDRAGNLVCLSLDHAP